MAKGKQQAKTASKNNPLGREAAKVTMYNNKKVVPVKIITGNKKFMGAQYDGGSIVTDPSGEPIAWKKINN